MAGISRLSVMDHYLHGLARGEPIGRCADETRRTFTDSVLVVMDDIVARLGA
ncbi:hypothetical protein [Streptomyces scabichelini]|uniref:hypothetical protein n=1 Tax=Streptomyces scabichelini TaxID=2711217 RepID=UPI003B973FA4